MIYGIIFWTNQTWFFQWNLDCQKAFKQLKQTFVFVLVLMKLDFNKTFILDVDWSTKGVRAILSQEDGRMEHIITYVSKWLSFIHKRPCTGNNFFGKGAWSTHGRGMLHYDMGDHAFSPIFLSKLFNFEDRLQTTIMVGYNVWCIR